MGGGERGQERKEKGLFSSTFEKNTVVWRERWAGGGGGGGKVGLHSSASENSVLPCVAVC